MKATITLQELAEKLNGKSWSKDGKERVYLDEGYNTKKMSTKTYVEVKNDEFVVRCFIDCPSQHDNWIESQEQEIIESVENRINDIIELSKVELIEARLSADETEVEVRISYNGTEEVDFLTESKFDERFNYFPQSVFENLPQTKAPVKKELFISEKPITEKKTYELGSGLKVSHPRFGLGEIIEEMEVDGMKKFKILFSTEGEKLLLERFANLTFL